METFVELGLTGNIWMCKMCQVGRRERYIGDLINEVEKDEAIHDMLTLCGMLKVFQIPLMHSIKLLLNKIVRFWDRDAKCFII